MPEHKLPPVGAYAFCDKHEQVIANVAEVKAIYQATKDIIQDLHDSLVPLLQGTDSYPVMVRRMTLMEDWQKAQIITTQETALTMQAIQTALAAKTEERRIVMDRSTKITVALIAALVALVSGAMAGGAAVYAAHQATISAVATTLAR